MTEKRQLFKKFTKFFGSNAGDNSLNSEPLREQIDTKAALDSFRTHWSQAYECMVTKNAIEITVDDVTSVINHIDQMVELLFQESNYTRDMRTSNESTPTAMAVSPLLDYLLMESVLEKLYNWSQMCGEWQEVMVLQQLKLYDMLFGQICHNTHLYQRPLIRPLLCLLSKMVDKVCHLEVEKRLVVLLNTLFVTVSHNRNLLELFFTAEPLIASHLETKFLLFSLLIPYVHRDGPVGQQARDSILLCMALSRKDDSMGVYVAEETDFCPVLATGLSGLYSSLPRRLLSNSITSDDWHQITNDDIRQNPELELFLNSLEFCNAVAQIAHPLIQNQLLQFIFNGFLVPVIAPALHQEVVGIPLRVVENLSKYSNTLEEIISTTAYFDLFVRTISEPNLLKIFLKFICVEKYEEQRIIDTLITRITAHSKLSLVTLVLFRSLMDLNCEDVLLELILKYLKVGNHVIGGNSYQMERMNDSNCLNESAQRFLTLIPKCCLSSHVNYMRKNASSDGYVMVDNDSHDIFENGSSHNSDVSSHNSDHNSAQEMQYLLLNYLDYLKDANHVISNCIRATRSWSCQYDACSHKSDTNCVNNNNICANSYSNDCNHSVPQTNGHSLEDNEDHCSPIGSFLETIFSRLESLCENDVYTNLQLTGLVSRLAAYPQPLLRSLLLNPNLVFQKNVNSLLKILINLSKKLDTMSVQIPNFDELVRRARQFLYSREHIVLNRRVSISTKIENDFRESNSRVSRSNSITSLSSQTGEVRKKSLREGIRDLFARTPRTMRRSPSAPLAQPKPPPPPILESVPGKGYRYFKTSDIPEEALDASEVEENERIQRIVLAAIVYEELVQELSAISYEHFTQYYDSKPK